MTKTPGWNWPAIMGTTEFLLLCFWSKQIQAKSRVQADPGIEFKGNEVAFPQLPLYSLPQSSNKEGKQGDHGRKQHRRRIPPLKTWNPNAARTDTFWEPTARDSGQRPEVAVKTQANQNYCVRLHLGCRVHIKHKWLFFQTWVPGPRYLVMHMQISQNTEKFWNSSSPTNSW